MRSSRRVVADSFAFRLLLATVSLALPAHNLASAQNPQDRPRSKTRDAVARRAFVITDTVLEHHIDPPTRQQMILNGIKALFSDANREVPPQMGRRVSDVRTPDELSILLNDVWPRISEDDIAHQMWEPVQSQINAAFERSRAAPRWDLRWRVVEPSSQLVEALIGRAASQSNAGPARDRRLEDVFVNGLLRAVPGRPILLQSKEARVQAQLQANRYVGIGITLGHDTQSNLPKIGKVFPGGPAEYAGLKENDLIEQIDLWPVEPGARVRDVIDRIRGVEGSRLTLKVRQADSLPSRMVSMERQPVMIRTVNRRDESARSDATQRVDPALPIGYLKINAIGGSTVSELRQWEVKLRADGIQALILDFRSTGSSGMFDVHHSAVLLADSLLDGGTIGRLRTRDGVHEYVADRDCLFRGWPLAFLIDQNTRSAATWVAAALQDSNSQRAPRRATIVGTASRGDNFERSAVPVPGSGESLNLATGRWERPDRTRQDDNTTDSDRPRRLEFGSDDTPWQLVPDRVVEQPNEEGVARAARPTAPSYGPEPAQRVVRQPATVGVLKEPASAPSSDPMRVALEELRWQLSRTRFVSQ